MEYADDLNIYREVSESEDTSKAQNHAESEEERYVGSMLLEPRSLFLMTDDAYENLLHGIKEVTEDVIDEKIFNGEEHRGKTLTFLHNPPCPCRVEAEHVQQTTQA
ncbi:hypothetical protein ANCDUO_08809 [Ancylostoma duodenale]|uniref:Alpha-ketoglutarate-dependent dioxygenase AlkB-like domain-containing protein n=1 Tax=Ancylostoma duodenale TaxID=51022 RepID=A0A0C2CVM2_9BILA|nr:hypothetical protein ANCDUO_08809 [Ancylostoma duodenale]